MKWKVPVAEPVFSRREISLLSEVMRRGRITQGSYVERFEHEVARMARTRFAVATSSGTAAVHCALMALGVGSGDEVITTPLSCIASSNPILFQGAKPVFVDIDPNTYNMDVRLVEKAITRKTKAILAVHLFGRPMEIVELVKIARENHIALIEDCCQAMGAEVNSRPVGSFGDIGCFSFYANKIITTGEGGMAVTSRPDLNRKMRGIRNLGQDGLPFVHPWIGANYKMTNLHAAVGLAQMERLNSFTKARQETSDLFSNAFLGLKGIRRLPSQMYGTRRVYFSYSLEMQTPALHKKLTRAFRRAGIETRPFFSVIPDQLSYRRLGYKGSDVPEAMNVFKSGIYVSCSPAMSSRQKDLIIRTVQKACA